MKRIAGLTASPRKTGNCEIALKKISEYIEQPHEIEIIRLHDYDIRYCDACYKCLFGEERCTQNDDFYKILDKIAEADALITAAPVYFFGANASLKIFLDRFIAAYPLLDRMWMKPSIGITVAGIEGKEGHAQLEVENFLKMALTEIKESIVLYAAHPGDVILKEENLEKIESAAGHLFGKPAASDAPVCSLCGGSSFRFLDNINVKCLLCSNSGTIKSEEGRTIIEMTKGEKNVFLTKDEVLSHRLWLRDMKNEFKERKKELIQVIKKYRK